MKRIGLSDYAVITVNKHNKIIGETIGCGCCGCDQALTPEEVRSVATELIQTANNLFKLAKEVEDANR